MKYAWNAEKNRKLRAERGVGFEDIVSAIDQGCVLDVIPHPNSGKYPHQLVYVVYLNDYVYLVPFVETEHGVFLKTIIPNRKAKRDYLGR
ncbi:MAG: BrnT family toxin [SAR324 cluster bacterium]|nr:BrnT family toxin [SAR324 cluster bacterium]